MITDPRTAPETARGRKIYAITIGLLASLLIAPQTTEFAAKVALLGTLTIVCAARPLLILGREAIARRQAAGRWTFPQLPRRRPALAAVATFAAAGFAGALVVAGSPARSLAGISAAPMSANVHVTIGSTPGVVSLNEQTAAQVAADAIDDLRLASQAVSTRSLATASQCAGGTYLADLRTQITRSTSSAVAAPSYDVRTVHLALRQAVGQAPPTVVATMAGNVTQLGTTTAFTRTFELALDRNRFLIIGTGAKPSAATPSTSLATPANAPKGTASFAAGAQLTNVAGKVGLNFTQDAFHYSMADDPQAMMGGGVCWIDYNNDGWLDLYAVNSYADADLPDWEDHGGLPRSELFRNDHGTFVNVTASSRTGVQAKGTGCVAADLNGDGYTDLVVTTATGIRLLWNNGNGSFRQAASSSGINPDYAWYSSASVADVNGDGRPDLFVAGYTNMLDRNVNSIAGFPTNYQGVRDLLYLNEGNGPNGRAHFKDVGVEAGLESSHFSHGLGSVFTDVNGDGRPDLYVANDEDPNQLYVNKQGGALGFHFVDEARAYGVADPNAGMGVAEGDYNGDGLPDLFITNSRGQPHAAYQSTTLAKGETGYTPEMAKFGKALDRKSTVGWGDAFVDLNNDSKPDLILANGAIPVTSLKKDTEPLQVLQALGDAKFQNASGIISQAGLPKIIGRGLAVADFNNDGRMDVAINTIGGPLVLLENTGKTGNWLEVSLAGFHPGAIVTATLPNGQKLVQEIHAGSSYLSSEDPRVHLGLGAQTSVKLLTVRYPSGKAITLHNVRANRILAVGTR
jgi:hypothetical protein